MAASTTASVSGMRVAPADRMTSAPLVSFAKPLAPMAMKNGVRVNAVAPRPLWTPLIPSTMPAENVNAFGADTAFDRAAQLVEIPPLFVFLGSGESHFVTGEVYGDRRTNHV